MVKISDAGTKTNYFIILLNSLFFIPYYIAYRYSWDFKLRNILIQGEQSGVAEYSQITWGLIQRNAHLKVINNTFHLLVDDPELGINCDYIRQGYNKYPQGSHIIYYKEYNAKLTG